MPRVKIPKHTTENDMTPFVDVAFLILTFFIMATKFKPPEAVEITPPSSVSSKELMQKDGLLVSMDKDGRVFFTLPLQQNKFIEQGKLLGYINPPDSKYYVEISLPQQNSGKVDAGMQVQLRFDAYPYQEIGFVKGKLDYISPIASDTGFLATIRLDSGLVTNLKNKIQYKNGLQAQALVITKDMRLLQRLYYNIVKAISPGK